MPEQVHYVRNKTREKFNDLVTQLPQIKGNPRAPESKGNYGDLFLETSQ